MKRLSFFALLIFFLSFAGDSRAQCVGNISFTVSPPNQPYVNGQVVEICYSISSYTQLGSNWIHAYLFQMGPGWNPNSIVITQPPPGGGGTWGFYSSVTSNATGVTNGPGIYYNQGGDNNPGNNFGYSCPGCPSSVCFTVTVADASQDLSFWINVTGDGETGSWGGGSGDCPSDEADDLGTQVIGGAPPCGFTIALATTDPTCTASNGAIALTPNNGVAPIMYSWAGPGGPFNTADIVGLAAGNYSVTATDGSGCVATANATLTADFSDAPTVSVTVQQAPFCDNTNGELLATASGGAGAYSYAWSAPGGNAAALTNLGEGTYTVTVTDGAGCTNQANGTLVITESASVTAAVEALISCSYMCNGAANASPSGTQPFTYSWSNGATDQTPASLCPGTYSVTLTDAHQCTATASVDLTAPPAIVLQLTSQPTLCNGEANGTATADVQNGNAPYVYLWSPNVADSTATVSNIAGGLYYLTVYDDVGCSASGSVTVDEPLPMLMAFDAHITKCFGDSSGWIESAVVQGTPPYTFQWSDSAVTTQNIYNIPAGTYGLTITDASGCTIDSTVTVGQPEPLSVSFGTWRASCEVAHDGIDSAEASGGTPGYNYVWSTVPQSIGPIAYNLAPGTYTVTVTDANNCVLIDSSVVNAGTVFNVTATEDLEMVREYYAIVTVEVDTTGHFGYEWIPYDNVADPYSPATLVTPDSTTTYTVVVTNMETGCQDSDIVVVTVTPNTNLIVPNAFSPNGDDRNDFFFPIPGDGVTVKSFKVFNRWGECTFDDDWFPGWDGRTNDGKVCPMAVYVWTCDYELYDGTLKRSHGTVTLMR